MCNLHHISGNKSGTLTKASLPLDYSPNSGAPYLDQLNTVAARLPVWQTGFCPRLGSKEVTVLVAKNLERKLRTEL